MKLLTLFALLFVSATAGAQTYRYMGIPDSGATWSVVRVQVDPEFGDTSYYQNRKYRVLGDTIVDERFFAKVYESRDSVFNPDNARLLCYIREVGKKWYRFDTATGEDELIYDFGVLVFEDIRAQLPYDNLEFGFQARIIDTVVVGGFRRRRLQLSNISLTKIEYTWIEGIGSTRDLNHTMIGMVGQGQLQLLCFEEGDSVVYMNSPNDSCYYERNPLGTDNNDFRPAAFNVYPNPLSSDEAVRFVTETPFRTAELRVYTAVGQLIDRRQIADHPVNLRLTRGAYTYRITTDDGRRATGKLLVR